MTLREQFRKDALGTKIIQYYLGQRTEKVTLSQLESMDLWDSVRSSLAALLFVILCVVGLFWTLSYGFLNNSIPPYSVAWFVIIIVSLVGFLVFGFVEPPAVHKELTKDLIFLRASKWMKDFASLRASDRLDSDSVLQAAERELFGLALRLKFLEFNVRQSGVSTEEMHECLTEWKLKRTHFDEIYAFASKFVELRQKSYYFGVKES